MDLRKLAYQMEHDAAGLHPSPLTLTLTVTLNP